jgi:histidinol-phosphate aminotransferase
MTRAITTAQVQAHIARLAGYVPGEQPQSGGFLKLNTNESPYPPSPRVGEAIRALLGTTRLRLYPDPMATPVREAAAARHGVRPDWILAGNGSDDLLTILIRTFVAPGDLVIAPSPTYLLYRTLAELQDARLSEVPFRADWTLNPAAFGSVPGVRLAFLANPNSPSGTMLDPKDVAALARALPCPLVVDEAYADFANWDCVELVREHENLIITRTLSKAFGLAGLRMGYAIAQPGVIEQLIKVKDSYNCDTLSIVGGAAALADLDHVAETTRMIVATRDRLTLAMRELEYRVPESQANFVWCEGGPPATEIAKALKDRHILVRLMRYPGREPALRISVGTDAEIDHLLETLRPIVRAWTGG